MILGINKGCHINFSVI